MAEQNDWSEETLKEAARERRESIRAMPKGPRKKVAKRLHKVISQAEQLISQARSQDTTE